MSDSSRWKLHVYPSGIKDRQAGFISIEIVLEDPGSSDDETGLLASLTVSVIRHGSPTTPSVGSVDGTTTVSPYSFKSPGAIHFKEGQRSWGIDNFISREDLERKFLVNDAVEFAVDIEVFSAKPELLITPVLPSPVGEPHTLGDDLKVLFDDALLLFSDITIVSGGKKFPCHRCVLAARSKTFHKKFTKPSFSTKLFFTQGQYYVESIEPGVLEEVLKFIYTGKCSENTLATISSPLLTAASYYQIPQLVERCENYLGETLTTDNVIDVLNIACEVESSRLEVCCSEFIARHVQDILAMKLLDRVKPETLRKLLEKSILPGSLVAQAGGGSVTVPETAPGAVVTDIKNMSEAQQKVDQVREEDDVSTPATETKHDKQHNNKDEQEPTDYIPSKATASFTATIPAEDTRT